LPFILYPLLALLSFPTLGTLVSGEHGLGYALDVFDGPRGGLQADWLANGLTLWNPHATAGNSLLAQGNNLLIPDLLLPFAVGSFGAYAIVAWVMAAVAGVSMHLFLRDSLRLSTAAVVGGATIYLFGFWHYAYSFSVVAAPLLLWLIDRAVVPSPHRWRFVVAGALLNAFLLYNGIPQVDLVLAVVQLGFMIVTDLRRQGIAARIGVWAAMWGLALLLFAPTLLTQLVALPLSHRSIWDLRALYDPTPLQAVRDMLLNYSSTLFGVPLGGGIGVSPAGYGTYFLGAIGLPMLVLGIVGATHDRRTRFLLLLLVAIPVLDLLAVLVTPFQDQFGFLKSFQLIRIRLAFPLVLAASAAIGLDVLVATLRGSRPRLWSQRWQGIAVIASAVPLAIAAIVAVRTAYRLRHAILHLDVPAVGWALLVAALAIGAIALIGATAIALLRKNAQPGGRLATGVLLLLLVALAGERAIYAHGERLVGGSLGTWAHRLAETPGQAFLLRQPGIAVDRVLTFGDSANRMGVVGLLQVDGYEPVYPLTYHNFFGALIKPQLAVSPDAATYYRSWGSRAYTFGPRVDPELVALVGARWLYVKGTEVPTVPGIIARFHEGEVTVYEVPDVLPRAFVAGRTLVAPDAAAVVTELGAADLATLRGTVIVAAGPDADVLSAGTGANPGAEPGAADEPAGSATIISYTPDEVVVSVSASRLATLVLTDVMAPGWIAERDGVTVPIATVDGAFRGVPIGPDSKQVVFRYRPWFTMIGFIAAGLAFVVLVVWTAWLRRRDRRSASQVGLDPLTSSGPLLQEEIR
jgi:hypothetical protein